VQYFCVVVLWLLDRGLYDELDSKPTEVAFL
jgi:hypothetical protein